MLIEWIKSVFSDLENKIRRTSSEENKVQKDALNYYDTSKENITAIVSKTLSIITFTDSSVNITTKDNKGSKRTELLNEIAEKEFSKSVKKISSALGTGMIASIPYCADNGLGKRIYIDTVSKERFWITGSQGDDITEVVVLSDFVVVNNKRYLRWTNYSVKNGVYIITNTATNESGKKVPLDTVDSWKSIDEQIAISGVDKLPVAFYSCNFGERHPEGTEGVPITFGCGATIKKIESTLSEIEREFDKKKAKLLVPRMFLKPEYDEKGKAIKTFKDDLYVALQDGDENKITIFDPDIRESSYFTKLEHHFEFLEKEIGCSAGVLTKLITQGATATEIKRAMFSTFSVTNSMQKEYEKYFDTLMYSVNVLCNFYNLTPISDYIINYNWSYSLIEDTDKEWNQMKDLQSIGAVGKAEMRKWLTNESSEEAQKQIDEIRKREPPLSSMIGMSE